MPLVFYANKGTLAGSQSGQPLFKCCVNTRGKAPQCGKCPRCHALIVRGGRRRRCKVPACKDSEFCHHHLKKHDNVVIGESRIPGGGLGLFCWTARNIGDSERKNNHDPVFRRGDRITSYGGKHVSAALLSRWYDYKDDEGNDVEVTAPYAHTSARGNIRDAACLRRAGAYVNDFRGSGRRRSNAELRDGAVYALNDIYKGDELFVNYGRDYWETSSPEYITTTTKYKRPSKRPKRTSRGKKYR